MTLHKLSSLSRIHTIAVLKAIRLLSKSLTHSVRQSRKDQVENLDSEHNREEIDPILKLPLSVSKQTLL